MDTGSKMTEIFRRLKTEMNGAVVGAMKDRGLCYSLSYGVSTPTIKKIAKEYYPDHKLAALLFKQGVRELKIAAVHVDDPAMVTRLQMEEWSGEISTGELADLAAMGLFYASPDAGEVAKEWIQSGDPMLSRMGMYMAGRRAINGLSSEGEDSDVLKLAGHGISSGSISNFNASVYLICKIASRSETLRRQVVDAVEKMKSSGLESAKDIASEAETLLMYG